MSWWVKPGNSHCEMSAALPGVAMRLNLALLAAAATGVQVGATIAASRFVLADVPPLTMAVSTALLPAFQSFDDCDRRDTHDEVVRLLPSFKVNWGVVRAQ